jgi:hypothetical protein
MGFGELSRAGRGPAFLFRPTVLRPWTLDFKPWTSSCPVPFCRGSFLPLVKMDPHHRRESYFRSRRGSLSRRTPTDRLVPKLRFPSHRMSPVPPFFDLGPWTSDLGLPRVPSHGWCPVLVGILSSLSEKGSSPPADLESWCPVPHFHPRPVRWERAGVRADLESRPAVAGRLSKGLGHKFRGSSPYQKFVTRPPVILPSPRSRSFLPTQSDLSANQVGPSAPRAIPSPARALLPAYRQNLKSRTPSFHARGNNF